MPQFDQFSFFNQSYLFLFFFFNFYFFITFFLLPKTCYNIKFRKKKIKINIIKTKKIKLEKINIIYIFNYFYKNFYFNFESFYKKKLNIYKINQKEIINKKNIINNFLKQKLNYILNENYILIKKIFII